ncbi:hypothetical protein VNI00_005506 [Paramarasmius palmivorus]|uniref:Uncharacterized protein n=1 Tax=Paramarasmius palmivorus TaxID=297713 RepID=A0AAW0DCZ3_9AGAR
MKYLENNDEVPTERLQAILRIRAEDLPESPYPELDLLYNQILQACPKWDEVSKILRLLLPHGIRVPSTLARRMSIDWRVPQTPGFNAALLNFEPGKLQSLLFRLHSVIKVPSGKEEKIDSFTDYLLVPARSRAWHIEPYTEPEFYDLLSQTFLRAISIHSQRYLQTMQSGEPPIFVVFNLIRDVVSPSDELIAALNQFDPYPFATWLLNWSAFHGRDNGVAYWIETITWAESLGSRVPVGFLDTMESFLDAFCVGSPNTSASWLGRAMAFLEQTFYITDTNDHQHNWCQLLGYTEGFEGDNNIYILQADQMPPPSWSVFTVTREQGEAINRLLESLGHCRTQSLCNDLRHDTYTSVSQLDEAKHNDLYALKKLVAHRQGQFGSPVYPCTPPGIARIHPISEDGTSVEEVSSANDKTINEMSGRQTEQRNRRRVENAAVVTVDKLFLRDKAKPLPHQKQKISLLQHGEDDRVNDEDRNNIVPSTRGRSSRRGG